MSALLGFHYALEIIDVQLTLRDHDIQLILHDPDEIQFEIGSL